MRYRKKVPESIDECVKKISFEKKENDTAKAEKRRVKACQLDKFVRFAFLCACACECVRSSFCRRVCKQINEKKEEKEAFPSVARHCRSLCLKPCACVRETDRKTTAKFQTSFLRVTI